MNSLSVCLIHFLLSTFIVVIYFTDRYISHDWLVSQKNKHAKAWRKKYSNTLVHFTPILLLDHLWPLPFSTRIIYSTYCLPTLMKWKNSRCNKLYFNFVPLCHQIPEVVETLALARTLDVDLASMFTTSLTTWNCLKYPLLKAFAKKSLYQFISMIFYG